LRKRKKEKKRSILLHDVGWLQYSTVRPCERFMKLGTAGLHELNVGTKVERSILMSTENFHDIHYYGLLLVIMLTNK